MRPPTALLERLSTQKIMPLRANPTVGFGERVSRQKGAGMEFIDHRAYHEGDDVRHLDPHVLARTGEAVIRQYAQSRQLPVTVVLDASGSMKARSGEKFDQAKNIAQVFAFVGLVAGDRTQFVICGADGLLWSPRWQGVARAEPMFRWVADQTTGGEVDFARCLRAINEELVSKGLLVIVSDWWDADVYTALDGLNEAGHEVLAIQVLAPEERDPSQLGAGVVILEDAESGEDAEILMDGETLRRYAALLEEWNRRLAQYFLSRQWRFFMLPAEADLSEFCLRSLRAKGVFA